MKEIFHRSLNLTYRKDSLYCLSQNTIKFGHKLLMSLLAHIWNSSPEKLATH